MTGNKMNSADSRLVTVNSTVQDLARKRIVLTILNISVIKWSKIVVCKTIVHWFESSQRFQILVGEPNVLCVESVNPPTTKILMRRWPNWKRL